VETSRSRLKIVAKSSLIPPYAPPARRSGALPSQTGRLESFIKAHNAFAVRWPLKAHNAVAVHWPLKAHKALAVRWPRYFRAPRCRFFSLVCRSLRALRLGLLMAKVPLP
jgi:hypothetical protein